MGSFPETFNTVTILQYYRKSFRFLVVQITKYSALVKKGLETDSLNELKNINICFSSIVPIYTCRPKSDDSGLPGAI